MALRSKTEDSCKIMNANECKARQVNAACIWLYTHHKLFFHVHSQHQYNCDTWGWCGWFTVIRLSTLFLTRADFLCLQVVDWSIIGNDSLGFRPLWVVPVIKPRCILSGVWWRVPARNRGSRTLLEWVKPPQLFNNTFARSFFITFSFEN